MLWSVSIQAAGDRVLGHEEIVELADAVAPAGGVASGIGQDGVRRAAGGRGRGPGRRARRWARSCSSARRPRAGLPAWPVSAISAVSEEEDELP